MSFSGSSYLFWNLTSLLWSAWQLWRCKVSVLQMGKKCQSWSSFLLHLRKIAAKNPSLFFGEKLTVTINLILLKERNHWNISFGSSRERNSLKARNKDLTIEFVKICILGIAILYHCFTVMEALKILLCLFITLKIYNGRKFKHKKENNGSLRFTQMGLFRLTASFINSFDIFDIKTGEMLDSK